MPFMREPTTISAGSPILRLLLPPLPFAVGCLSSGSTYTSSLAVPFCACHLGCNRAFAVAAVSAGVVSALVRATPQLSSTGGAADACATEDGPPRVASFPFVCLQHCEKAEAKTWGAGSGRSEPGMDEFAVASVCCTHSSIFTSPAAAFPDNTQESEFVHHATINPSRLPLVFLLLRARLPTSELPSRCHEAPSNSVSQKVMSRCQWPTALGVHTFESGKSFCCAAIGCRRTGQPDFQSTTSMDAMTCGQTIHVDSKRGCSHIPARPA